MMLRTLGGFAAGTILTFLFGCSSVQPLVLGQGGMIERRSQGEVSREIYTGGGYSLETVRGDARFKMIHSPGLGKSHQKEAQEFKAEIGRLADLVGLTLNQGGHSEKQLVLLPTTFVNLDDLSRTSTFGRFCTEQLAEEMKMRDYGVVELRRLTELLILPRTGELALGRDTDEIFNTYKANAILIGTYTVAGQQVVLSVRLVQTKTNALMAVGTAIFDRNENLFLNSLLMREAGPTNPRPNRIMVQVPVSNKYAHSEIVEEDLKPERRVKQ